MPDAPGAARAFRSELYGCLGPRADALFELVDAAPRGGAAGSLHYLSLVPAHRRGHGSAYAALRGGPRGGRPAARPAGARTWVCGQ